MNLSRKCLCISCVGIFGILFAVSTVYACCGMFPVITDDPLDVVCVGQDVSISGTISAVEDWVGYPGSYGTDAALTVEVTSPCGEVTSMEATLSNLQEFPGPPRSASWDFKAMYTPTEAGTYTYVKIASWTTPYGTMFNTAAGTFDAVQCEGKVTGGGWFVRPGPDEKKDTFGFVAQYVQDSLTPQGNLEFQAHGGAINVHSTTITGLYVVDNTATFRGFCTVNGAPGFKFIAAVVDNGEPGKNNDTFAITVPTVFAIPPTTLDGGNIQVHKLK